MFDPLSVSQLTFYIRDLFNQDERMQDVWVQGEISNLTRAASGHWYFTLKDSGAQLKCVMWRSNAERQSFTPRNGDAVVAHGYLSVYEASGVYQLYSDRIRPVGIGDLYRQFEQLKARLDAEGLFDPARKRPIPMFPRAIGVVTSADAAAFQDIQNVLRRRYPAAPVILSSCLVQGEDAPPQIVAALARMNRYADVDVILLCRGGGSIEDLWAFNDERVARAVVASTIPVICGVGHETDFTIADFAADLRAPTPSAAAELATPDMAELQAILRQTDRDLLALMADTLERKRTAVNNMQRSMRHVSPAAYVRSQRQRIDDLNLRLLNAVRGHLLLRRERLKARESALNAANPDTILARGYSIITRAADGKRIVSRAAAAPGDQVQIKFHDGELTARIEDNGTHE